MASLMHLFVFLAGVFHIHGTKVHKKHHVQDHYNLTASDRHLALVICGTNPRYVNQAVRLMKSLVLSSTAKYSKAANSYNFWILADAEAEALLKPTVATLQKVADADPKNQKLTIRFLSVAGLDAKYGQTMNLFARCCMVPIFMHEVLPPSVKEIQLFGADQVVVDDLEGSWSGAKLNGWDGTTKMFGLAEECVEPRGSCGWYNSGGRTNGFGHNGFNSGSTLFSPELMRKYDYSDWALKATKTHKIELGDQDLMNLYAQQHPEQVSIQQCNGDVRTDSGCDVGSKPPIVLHGNRNVFETDASWRLVAERIDGLYNQLEVKGQAQLPGTSLWDAIGADARNGFMTTLSKPWGLSPTNSADLLKPLGISLSIRKKFHNMVSAVFARKDREHY